MRKCLAPEDTRIAMPHSIRIGDPVGLINNIARLYQSVTRILMEYVDNSLDDAEEVFRANGERYPEPVNIRVRINKKGKQVAVMDSCRGMKRRDLLRIVTDIADSNKKAQPWTHGEFGFGVHSFRACCRDIDIVTKHRDDEAYSISINRETRSISDEKVLPAFPQYESGTVVILKNFDAEWWKEVSPESIKEEIEKHFDRLLARENLFVTVDTGADPVLCTPFDYDAVPGELLTRRITSLGGKARDSLFLYRPIEIYLKVAEKPFPGRNPVFFDQGRRIEEIQSIKSYRNKSKYRTGLWGHPHLIGYVELNGVLKPVISRDDFQRGEARTEFYRILADMEDEIRELVNRRDRVAEEAGFGTLEGMLSKMMAKLARQDALSFRKGFLTGGDVRLGEDPASPMSLIEEQPGVEREGEGKGSGEPSGLTPVEEDSDGSKSGRAHHKPGFDLKFSPLSLDLITSDATGEPMRSSFADGTIVVYMEHPDFEERIERTRSGRIKLGSRLTTYISSIIATYYKDSFYEKYKFQPDVRQKLDSRVDMFDDHLGFTCRFEEMLQGFVGTDICSLEQIDEAEEPAESEGQ
jgi:arsenate reductase-like glutaredoxin family protein